ncbi:hypothetical protein LZ31DRAFT_433073, partial [Colletotrichum somersetense]
EIIHFLLSNGALVNAKDHYNATPLIAASRHGQFNAIELLLKAENICLDAKDKLGLIALCWARKSGSLQTIVVFIRHLGEIGVEATSAEAITGNRDISTDEDVGRCD